MVQVIRCTNQPDYVVWTLHLLYFTLRTGDALLLVFHKITHYLGWWVVFCLYKWLMLWVHLRKPQQLGKVHPGVSGSPCPYTCVLWKRIHRFCQEDFGSLQFCCRKLLFFLHQTYYFLKLRLWWFGLTLLGKERGGAGLDQEDVSLQRRLAIEVNRGGNRLVIDANRRTRW